MEKIYPTHTGDDIWFFANDVISLKTVMKSDKVNNYIKINDRTRPKEVIGYEEPNLYALRQDIEIAALSKPSTLKIFILTENKRYEVDTFDFTNNYSYSFIYHIDVFPYISQEIDTPNFEDFKYQIVYQVEELNGETYQVFHTFFVPRTLYYNEEQTFYNRLPLKFYSDSSLSKYSVTAIRTDTRENVIETVGELKSNENIEILPIVFNKKCTSKCEILFTLTGMSDDNIITRKNSFTLTAEEMPDLNAKPEWTEAIIISPFTIDSEEVNEADKVATLQMPEGFNWNKFNEVDSNNKQIWNWNFSFSFDNFKTKRAPSSQGKELTIKKANIFTKQDFKDGYLKTTNGWKGQHQIQGKLTIEHNNGIAFFTFPLSSLVLNFNEKAENINIEEYDVGKGGVSSSKFYLQSGFDINFKISAFLYTAEQISIGFLYNNTSEGEKYRELSRIKLTKVLNYASGDGPVENSIEGSLTFYEKILQDKDTYWKIALYGEDGRELGISGLKTIPALRHQEAQDFKINQINQNTKDNNITLIVNSSYLDIGCTQKAGNTTSAEVELSTKYKLLIKDKEFDPVDNSSENFEVSASVLDATTLIYLKLQTTIKQTADEKIIENIVETISQSYTLSIEAPTISYRRNCLGINTKDPQNANNGQAILTVSPTLIRNKIVFNSLKEPTAIKLKNLAEAITNWEFTNAMKVNGEIQLFGGKSPSLVSQKISSNKIISDNLYYGREFIKTPNGDPSLVTQNTFYDDRFEIMCSLENGQENNLIFGHNRGNFGINGGYISGLVRANFQPDESQSYVLRTFMVNGAQNIYIKDILVINLTEAFGVGNEPSKEWCDFNIPFFLGEYELDNNFEIIATNGVHTTNFIINCGTWD